MVGRITPTDLKNVHYIIILDCHYDHDDDFDYDEMAMTMMILVSHQNGYHET